MLLAEKRSLLKFVSVFVALNTIFLITLSVLYYNYQRNIFTEILQNEMINYAENMSESVYDADSIEKIDDYMLHDQRFDTALLTKEHTVLFPMGDVFAINFKKGFSSYEGHYFYIKTIELDQLKKVHYLVIRAEGIDSELAKTRKIIYIALFFSILFFAVVIFILSKLFLRPLREYIELLDRFIRDATHELNTPISILSMSIERMKERKLDEKNNTSLQRMDTAVRTLSHLYDDLSFLMVPKQGFMPSELQVNDFLRERVEFFLPLAASRQITFHTDLQECTLFIDSRVMNRIIDNLLSNAVKYNKRGGSINIRLTADSLMVTDTGVGFDMAQSTQIFERYTRLESANGGFGLGLSIVKSLCDIYGITIDVTSEVNVGSTFLLSWKNSRIVHN